MLREVLKKYQSNKKNINKSVEALRQKIEQQIEIKTIKALKVQNHKIVKVHSNQQEIENRMKKNQELKQQLKKQLNDWFSMYDKLNNALKKAGDLVNYAEYIENQLDSIIQPKEEKFDKKVQSIPKMIEDSQKTRSQFQIPQQTEKDNLNKNLQKEEKVEARNSQPKKQNYSGDQEEN